MSQRYRTGYLQGSVAKQSQGNSFSYPGIKIVFPFCGLVNLAVYFSRSIEI
jgi:hypothetical protein